MAAGEYYVPSQDEIDGFDELLAELPDDLFTAENVATLAGDYRQRRAAGKTIRLRVPGADPQAPAPQPPSAHPNTAVDQR
jgi:hypothetical protein